MKVHSWVLQPLKATIDCLDLLSGLSHPYRFQQKATSPKAQPALEKYRFLLASARVRFKHFWPTSASFWLYLPTYAHPSKPQDSRAKKSKATWLPLFLSLCSSAVLVSLTLLQEFLSLLALLKAVFASFQILLGRCWYWLVGSPFPSSAWASESWTGALTGRS